MAGHVVQVPAAPPARNRADRAADGAGIEKLYKHDIDATLSLDPVALTEMWTDDAVRIGLVPPAEVGKQAIREGNERMTANKEAKVLSHVPEHREMIFLDGGWEIEWRPYTASYVASPGGAPVQLRGMVLGVHKKLPDGTWKGIRGAGIFY